MRTKESQESNNKGYIRETFDEIDRFSRQARGMVNEMHGWFGRIDRSIDEIGRIFGVVIPYGNYGTGEYSDDWSYYNSAHRLELLEKKIRERV